jgi:putative transposase
MMRLDEQQLEARFLIHDRDSKFTAGFRSLFPSAGIRCLRTPLLAPDAIAFAEAWIGALKRECVNYFLCFSLGRLDHIGQELRPVLQHTSPTSGARESDATCCTGGPLEGPAIDDAPEPGSVRWRPFLGGLLRHYHRPAA